MSRIIGYARVSTEDQNLAMQRDALEKAGASPIFEDKASGAVPRRTGLMAALAELQAGDTLAIWRLDRLGRSLRHLIETAETIQAKGCHLISLTESINTTTAAGRVLFNLLGALAEFERETISERVTAGMASAKRHGKHMGRPSKFTRAQADAARTMLAAGQSQGDVTRALNISRATLWRGLKAHPET